MITITITGPRGSGKTTTAIEVAKLLHSLGSKVEFRGLDDYWTKRIKREIENVPLKTEPFAKQLFVTIIDQD